MINYVHGKCNQIQIKLRNTGSINHCFLFLIQQFCCFTSVKVTPHQLLNSHSTPLLSHSQVLRLQQSQEGKAVHPRTWNLPLPPRMFQKLYNRDWKNTSMPQTKQNKKETQAKLGEWDVLSRSAVVWGPPYSFQVDGYLKTKLLCIYF